MTRLIAIALLSTALLSGCANQKPSLPQTCFGAGQVAAWRATAGNLVLVNAKNGFFEVKVMGACPDIEFQQSIGFWSRTGRICGAPWDELRFGPDSFTREFYTRRSRCMLESVTRITREQFFGEPEPS